MSDHAEQMQAVRVPRVDRQDLAINPFGFGNSPSSMMPKGLAEHGRNVPKRALGVVSTRLLCERMEVAVHRFLLA